MSASYVVYQTYIFFPTCCQPNTRFHLFEQIAEFFKTNLK